MDHGAKACRILLLASVVVFASGAVQPSPAIAGAVQPSPATAGAVQPALTVTKESRVSIDADNQPLNALLRMMAEKKLFVLSGPAPGNESLTLHFSNLTVPEALSKILRGYNYVVIERGKGQAPTLSVMGRVQAAAPEPRARAAPTAPAVPPEQRNYAPAEPAAAPETPRQAQARPPAANAQTPQGAELPNEAARQTGQMATGTQPAGQAPQAGPPARKLLNEQPGGETQPPAGQQAPPGQQAPEGQTPQGAEAPPAAESPGVRF
jgi:hypothetical protein